MYYRCLCTLTRPSHSSPGCPPPNPPLAPSTVVETESGGPQDPYSDASAKYGPLKLPQLQPVDLGKMYGGAAQVKRRRRGVEGGRRRRGRGRGRGRGESRGGSGTGGEGGNRGRGLGGRRRRWRVPCLPCMPPCLILRSFACLLCFAAPSECFVAARLLACFSFCSP